MGVQTESLQDRMETSLNRGTQCIQTLDGLRVFLSACATLLFHIFEVSRLVLIVELTQSLGIHYSISLIHIDVLQTVPGFSMNSFTMEYST